MYTPPIPKEDGDFFVGLWGAFIQIVQPPLAPVYPGNHGISELQLQTVVCQTCSVCFVWALLCVLSLEMYWLQIKAAEQRFDLPPALTTNYKDKTQIHSFTHWVNEYSLNTYYVPGIVLGAGYIQLVYQTWSLPSRSLESHEGYRQIVWSGLWWGTAGGMGTQQRAL